MLTRAHHRWWVLFGAWSVYAAFGLLVSMTGALVPEIQADLGLTDSQMGFVLGAWQLVFIGSSIPSGRLIDRFGIRRALLGSMIVMLLSGVGRALAWDAWSLFAAVAFLGIGAPIVSIGAPKVAASLFEDRDRRLAIGIYSTAPGIGQASGLLLPANVVGPLVDDEWRLTVLVLTCLAAVALAVWTFVSRGLDALIAPGSGPNLTEYRAIARTPVVRFVLILSILNFFFVHGVGQWMVTILNSAGWSTKEAGSLAAFGTVGSLVSSFVLPRVAAPERRPALMVGSLLLGAASLNLLLSSELLTVAPAVLIATVSRTALMPLMILTLMDHRDVGPQRIAAATGLFFASAQIGGVTGPIATGFLSDMSGGFRAPLILHSGVMVLIALSIAIGYRRALGGSGVS